MFASRSMFVFTALFLAMVITISTAPIVDHEFVADETTTVSVDEAITTTDEIKETSEIPEVITDKLLFFDVTQMPLDENVKTGNTLLFEKAGEVPVLPATEYPQSFQMTVPTDTVTDTVTEQNLSE